jgi:organic hydroperoxide reductase OsmC/OhrA
MHHYSASIRWSRHDARFSDQRYSRAHSWHFDGGAIVPASASPLVVRPQFTDPAGVDPEEAFVASLSSCHMLWFLHIAAQAGFIVDDYVDDAIGTLGVDERGRESMTTVTLRPRVRYSGTTPDRDAERALHHEAHEACYIANSVRTQVTVEPMF